MNSDEASDADVPPASESLVDDGEDLALQKFEASASLADTFFFYDYWSAWSLNPDRKTVAPITRIYIGDNDGNLLFHRNVEFTAIIDLVESLAGTLAAELGKLEKIGGYKFHIPGQSSAALETLRDTIGTLSKILTKLESGNWLVGSDEIVDGEHAQTPKRET